MYSTGIWMTNEDRLMQFYVANEPKKANKKHITKILRKWRNKEDRLFQVLADKYSEEE